MIATKQNRINFGNSLDKILFKGIKRLKDALLFSEICELIGLIIHSIPNEEFQQIEAFLHYKLIANPKFITKQVIQFLAKYYEDYDFYSTLIQICKELSNEIFTNLKNHQYLIDTILLRLGQSDHHDQVQKALEKSFSTLSDTIKDDLILDLIWNLIGQKL